MTQFSLIFQCISYLCHQLFFDGIRDFRTFSEIPELRLTFHPLSAILGDVKVIV